MAVANGHLEIVELPLKRGPNLKATDVHGDTNYPSCRGRERRGDEGFVIEGLNVNCRNKRKETTFQHASKADLTVRWKD